MSMQKHLYFLNSRPYNGGKEKKLLTFRLFFPYSSCTKANIHIFYKTIGRQH